MKEEERKLNLQTVHITKSWVFHLSARAMLASHMGLELIYVEEGG